MQQATKRASWHILGDDTFTCCFSHELGLVRSIVMQTSYRTVVISGLLDHRFFETPLATCPLNTGIVA